MASGMFPAQAQQASRAGVEGRKGADRLSMSKSNLGNPFLRVFNLLSIIGQRLKKIIRDEVKKLIDAFFWIIMRILIFFAC